VKFLSPTYSVKPIKTFIQKVMSYYDKVRALIKPRKWDLTVYPFAWKYQKVSIPEPFKSTHYYRGPFFLRVWEDPRKANKVPIRLSL
jgi:hypothetical protein